MKLLMLVLTMFITGLLLATILFSPVENHKDQELIVMADTIIADAVVDLEQAKEMSKDPGPLPHEDAYIYIERDSMTISLYRDGDIYEKYPVASIRRIGSKYDTPTGLFTILTKEPNHFSSIGHVWMPYSMQFDGDFFIHGWPYYPDGTWVSPGYSGGCVRLLNVVAEAVYDFAYIGMPVLII